MGLRIKRVNDGYRVNVSPPHGRLWRSDHAMPPTDVLARLEELGCHSTDVTDALDAADVEWADAGGRTDFGWATQHDAEVLQRRANAASQGEAPSGSG
jgi:hypothetical protein